MTDDLKQIQSVRQKRRLESTLFGLPLPVGMDWVQNSLSLERKLNPDPSSYVCGSWLIYLTAQKDATHFWVKGFRFGWLSESADPSHIQDRVETGIRDFQRDIASGKAIVIQDGDLIPDNCVFNEDTPLNEEG